MIEIQSQALLQQLGQVRKEFKRKLEATVVEVCEGVVSSAVNNTPLGDSETYARWYQLRAARTGLLPQEGYAQGSWQVSYNSSFSSDAVYSGSAALSNAKGILSGFNLGKDVYIGNNAYYIGALENNYSPQTAGAGIVQPTLSAVQALYATSLMDIFNRA